MSQEAQETSSQPTKIDLKKPSLLRNYVSFIGMAIVFASFASIVLLFLLETTASAHNPYLGIFTYILFPAIMVFGLLVIFLGTVRERRRRRKVSPDEVAAYPVLDFNNPRSRRGFFIFLGLSFIFVFMTVFGSYRAYEYSESVTFCGKTCHSVMKPEFVAFQASPHANLRCVDCHVGAGAGGYVSAKLAGVRQLFGVIFNNYSKPVRTPVHNMPAPRETCMHCHWSEKFHGDQLRVFNHYAGDEKNTFRQTRLLVHVGGGNPATGPVTGIHWHMNLANEVDYIAMDEQRQDIPWVRFKDRQGNVVEYLSRNAQLTPEQIAQAPKRRMDCIDCHNRPAHVYLPPDIALNNAFLAGRLDATLPYLKRQAMELLDKNYSTNDEAIASIASGLDAFYRANYADLYSQKGDSIKAAISEVQRIYQTYFFPEMKTSWRTHPNNIGHLYFQGCFRCHDGEHVSSTGKVISNDCNVCHKVFDQTAALTPTQNEEFRHPVALGDLAKLRCTVCHKDNKPFQHPVNLGDISRFKCIDCHSGKVWTKGNT
ncbi:MAG: NapC/NirT family cytochrome c [Pyrinomonadaceae bacterium]|nr:NapC/NirT family cytochrome c [Pyrinomonadaceae bacterium]